MIETTTSRSGPLDELAGRPSLVSASEASSALTRLLAKATSRQGYLNSAVHLLQSWSGCRCVGIRVLDSSGRIPYSAYTGFSKEFWESENNLLLSRDSCICTRIISGHPEPQDLPCMTPGGSFLSGDTGSFVGGLSEEDRARFRGVCVHAGFSTVCITPVRHEGQLIGAIHLADCRQQNIGPTETLLVEQVAPIIGEAISRFRLKEKLREIHDTQSIINSLLQLSLEGRPLDAVLEEALTMLLSLPWLSTHRAGSIFLLEGDPGILSLKASAGLSSGSARDCAAVPLGQCVCGQAALRDKITFVECDKQSHMLRFESEKHCHCCIPIVHAGKTLGLINIYIGPDHCYDRDQREPLSAMAGALASIIHRSRLEQSLQKSEKQYRELVENSNCMVVRMDASGKITFASQNACGFFCHKPGELIGMSAPGSILPDEFTGSRSFRELVLEVAAQTGQSATFEVECTGSDLKHAWVSWTGTALLNDRGEPDGLLCVGAEVTRRKCAEEAFRKQAEILQTIIDHVPAMICSHDASGTLQMTNREFERLTGWSFKDASQRNIMQAIYPDQDLRRTVAEYMSRATSEWKEFPLRTRSGDCLNSAWSNAVLSDGTHIGIGIDLSEQKRSEQAFRAQAQLLDAFFSHTLTPLVILDRNFSIVRVNKAYANACLRSAEDLAGISLFNLYSSDLREMFEQVSGARSIRQAFAHPLEFQDQPERGVTYWDWTLVPIGEEGVDFFVFSLNEVTERVKSESALRESEYRFRSSVENMLDAFGIYSAVRDADGRIEDFRIEYVNEAACVSNDLPRERLIGSRLLDILPGHRGSELFHDCCMVVEMGNSLSAEVPWPPAMKEVGQKRIVEIRASKLHDGFIASWRDITPRKLAEEALRNSRQLLERILLSLDDVLFIVTPSATGGILSCNSALTRVFGYSEEDVVGNSTELLHADSQASEEFGRQLSASLDLEGVFRTEYTMRRKDGALFPAEHSVTQVLQGGKPAAVVWVVRDISERRKAEEQLQENLRQLERSNKALDEFATIASHDLKAPLRRIRSFGSLLKSELGSTLGEQASDYLQRMDSSALKMNSLIDSLLSFSRASSTQGNFQLVNLAEVVREVLGDLEPHITELGAKIQVGPLPIVESDPIQMKQLLQNLIGNSLNYSSGEPVISVVGEPAEDGTGCRLVVQDNGIGFDQRQAEKLFSPFCRLREAGKRCEGTGMGLAICRKIAKRHGGFIEAAGVRGLGATFTVHLPVGVLGWSTPTGHESGTRRKG